MKELYTAQKLCYTAQNAKIATRISNKILEDGTKVRVCKKCGETF